MSLPTDQEMDNAIREMALVPRIGALVYRRLNMVLLDVSASSEAGALQYERGRRSLALQLKLLMDEEFEKVAQRDGRIFDPYVSTIIRRAKPVSVTGTAGGRRVEPYPDARKSS